MIRFLPAKVSYLIALSPVSALAANFSIILLDFLSNCKFAHKTPVSVQPEREYHIFSSSFFHFFLLGDEKVSIGAETTLEESCTLSFSSFFLTSSFFHLSLSVSLFFAQNVPGGRKHGIGVEKLFPFHCPTTEL